jgi:hypothetical protein
VENASLEPRQTLESQEFLAAWGGWVKNVLFILVVVWFVLGCSVANDRGYFNARSNHDCTFIGSGLLTVIAGPINYLGVHPRADC